MTIKEIRDMATADLLTQIDDLKEELFSLRFKKATGQLENPHQIKQIRKTIARIKTVITEREMQEEVK